MTEETRVIKRFKPFILGFCICGCGNEIKIRTTKGLLKRFEIFHGTPKGINHYNYKKGWWVSRRGYIVIRKKGHPNADKNGNIFAHRWIMSEWLERPLTKDEDVHHIDGNKQNNLIFNLQLIDHTYHSYIERKKNMSERFCLLCGSKTTFKKKSKSKKLNLSKVPCWNRHPITKEKWICTNCYRKLKRQMKKKNKNQTLTAFC